jgi:hypothetical protein
MGFMVHLSTHRLLAFFSVLMTRRLNLSLFDKDCKGSFPNRLLFSSLWSSRDLVLGLESVFVRLSSCLPLLLLSLLSLFLHLL